ncbi:MAG TPA: ABC transporter permease [Micromonosporaceae bacterium]|nr:ABC transporter permease [Micromonosporaceae bacterium]
MSTATGTSPAAVTSSDQAPASRKVLNPRIIGLLIAITVAVVVFSVLNSNFLNVFNLLTLAQSMASTVILAVGLTYVILTGEIDLSVGSIFGFAPMATALLWVGGMPMLLALAIGIASGVVIGLINGLMVTQFDIPSFIVTLGSMNVIYGLTLLISEARSIDPAYADTPVPAGEYETFRALAASQLFPNFSTQIWWFITITIVLWFVLHRTLFGFRLTAIGGSVESARTARLGVRRYVVATFTLAGGLAGLGGILAFSFLGSTDPSAGQDLLFPAFAAVIVGGTSLNGGVGTIGGTLVGAVLLSILGNGLSLIGVGSFAQLIFVGAITILAVLLDRWTTSRHQAGRYRA